MKKTLIIFLTLILFHYCGFSLAPQNDSHIFNASYKDIIFFFSIEQYDENSWEKLSEAEIQKLIGIGIEIILKREILYKERLQVYLAKGDIEVIKKILYDVGNHVSLDSKNENLKQSESDAFFIKDIIIILNEILQQKITKNKKGEKKLLFNPFRKFLPSKLTKSIKKLKSIFNKYKIHINDIQEQELVLRIQKKIKRVLIVDDEPNQRKRIFNAIIKYDDSIEIVEASSAFQALHLVESIALQESMFDVVISDQSMPVYISTLPDEQRIKDESGNFKFTFNGDELIFRLKEKYPKTYYLMNTGGSTDELLYRNYFDGIIKDKSSEINIIDELQRINIKKTREYIEEIFLKNKIPILHSFYIDYLNEMALIGKLNRISA